MRERVFVDTSAYYALSDPSEGTRHQQAQSMLQRLAQAGADLYTTTYVVAETHALVLNRTNRDLAERILDELHASTTRIIRATEGDETHAREIIHRYHDKPYTLADAVSFAVMHRLHLKIAWTYDHHFEQMGFTRIE